MYLPPYIRDIHGTVFPPSPVERELFYRDDLHIWYIYDGTAWVSLLTGMIIHGNAWHAPAFATAAALLAHIAATGAPIHGSSVAAAINTLIHRDAAGRAKIVNPAVAADIDNLGARDAAIVLAIAIHAALTTGIHGVGAGTIAEVADIAVDANLSAAAQAAIAAAHARQHAITQPLDHTSGATPGQILEADANGLPVDATNTDAEVAAAVALAHAQDHHARHEPGGADPMAVDQAAGTGSLRTLGGGAVQAAPGNHTHSLDDDTSGLGVSGTIVSPGSAEYEYTRSMPSHAYWTIASTTPNFAAGSLAFGAASFHGRGSTYIALKLVLGGVTVATSGGCGGADYVLCVKGFRALSGAQLCRARLYNRHTVSRNVFTYAHYSAIRSAGAIAVGSVKFV